MPMRNYTHIRGYTLIELIVSVAIFTIVMLVASTAFLALINLDRKARATNDVVTNLSYVVDSMERSIRTGTEYDCGTVGGATDCWSTPADSFSFLDSTTPPQTVEYRLFVSDSQGQIQQRITPENGPSGSWTPLTDPRVDVENLAFYVRGSTPGDSLQPIVVLVIRGALRPDANSTPVEFVIESAASQRLIDI